MYPFLQKLFADGGYQGPEFATALTKVRPHLPVESSSGPIASRDLSFYRNAGSSNARLLGSIAVEGSPRIGRTAIEKRWLSCTSPQFDSCFDDFVILPKLSGQTLRIVRAIQRAADQGVRL
jgi:hypothetical protein